MIDSVSALSGRGLLTIKAWASARRDVRACVQVPLVLGVAAWYLWTRFARPNDPERIKLLVGARGEAWEEAGG